MLGDLLVGDGIDEVQVAGHVGVVDSGVIGAQHELQGFDGNAVGIVVVGVLGVGHAFVMVPSGAGVGTVGDEAGFQSPGAGVGAIGVSSFHRSLRDREEGRESAQAQEVRAGADQGDGQGVVFGSLNTHQDVVGFLLSQSSVAVHFSGSAVLFAGSSGSLSGSSVVFGVGNHFLGSLVLGDQAVEQVAVVGSGHRVGGTVPAVDEVLSGQVGAVAPLALTQVEGVGHAVLGNIVAFRHAGNQLAVFVVGQQTDEAVDSQNGAVNGGVQSRIQTIGLRRQVDVQRAGVGVEHRLSGRGSRVLRSRSRRAAAGSCGAGSAAASQADDHGGSECRCHELFHCSFLLEFYQKPTQGRFCRSCVDSS